MPNPSLADRGSYLANVLNDQVFQQTGILWGYEPTVERDCRWVVLDPNRFTMRVWTKPLPTMDVVAYAQSLGATVFTNGPYFQYAGAGPLGYLVGGYRKEHRHIQGVAQAALGPHWYARPLSEGVATAATLTNWFDDASGYIEGKLGRKPQARALASPQAWVGLGPCGYVLSESGVNIRTMSSPNLAYFGRHVGTDFASYAIANGDPDGFSEAIGGMSLVIKDYASTGLTQSSQWCYWALAPLSPNHPPLAGTNLQAAMTAYGAAPGVTQGAPPGLIIGMYYMASNRDALLLDVGVRDAVQLDGSDSVIFGAGQTVYVGDGMIGYKRTTQGWGFAFYPAT